jgi:hypothetical protein
MTDRDLMQQALEALETADEFDFWLKQESIVKALRERLAQIEKEPFGNSEQLAQPAPVQPEQEPVAWMHTMIDDVVIGHRPADLNRHPERWKPLCATPPAAERNKLASWMMAQGYATGHGDTIEQLLDELRWQVRESEREACAKVCDELHPGLATKRAAEIIRARDQR